MTEEATAPRPRWWFAVVWVTAFLAPIAVEPNLFAGMIVFVPISAAATGVLLASYLPRPWVWVRNTVLALGLMATAYGLLFVLFPLTFPILMIVWIAGPILVPVAGLVVGASQAYAFVRNGEKWSASRRARGWVWVSGWTWLAMSVVPWLMRGEPFRLDMALDFRETTLALFVGGAVSCAGMLWILLKLPERRDDEAAQPPH